MQNSYDELALYTLQKGDPEFIHQHIVDAYTAQTATPKTKHTTLTFALVGLYLHIEKNYTGREVQFAHIKMARDGRLLEEFDLPIERGQITVQEVLAAKPGKDRDAMINIWTESVWKAYKIVHKEVAELAQVELSIDINK